MGHCACGGAWEGTVDRETCVKRLGVLGRVGTVYGFRMLGVVVAEVVGGI